MPALDISKLFIAINNPSISTREKICQLRPNLHQLNEDMRKMLIETIQQEAKENYNAAQELGS
jgi:hypothetical protein